MRVATLIRSRTVAESSRTVRNALAGLMFGFGCGIASARLLGPADRGSLALLVASTGICALVSALGTNVALRVDLHRDPRVSLQAYLEVSALLAVLHLVLMGSVIAVLLNVGLIPRHHVVHTALIGVVLACAAFAAQQLLDLLNAVGRNSTAALFNSLGSLVTLLALLVAWVFRLGLPAAALAYALGFASVAGLSSAALRGKVPRVSGSQAVGRGLLVRRGVRLLGLNLGQALTFRLDHFVVGAVVGPMALGQLSVAAAHAAPSQVCSNSIGQVAFREAAQNRFDRTKALSMCLAAVVLASGSAIVLWCITPWLVPLIFGPAFANSVPLVRVLVIGQITSAPYLVLSKALAGQGRVRTSSWGGAAFLVVLLLALVVLTPAFGVMGAAWAGVIASSVMSAAMLAAGLLTGPWGRTGADGGHDRETTASSALRVETESAGPMPDFDARSRPEN